MTWLQTYKGRKFDLINPSPILIDAEEIAVCLSRICRFGGHCEDFYSVAQHSVFVCDLVEDETLKLPALLHDAHEMYWGFGDIQRPAKALLPLVAQDFLELHEARINLAIANRFGFEAELFEHPEIKHADNVALATEARDLMENPPAAWEELPEPYPDQICALTQHEASVLFLRTVRSLTN